MVKLVDITLKETEKKNNLRMIRELIEVSFKDKLPDLEILVYKVGGISLMEKDCGKIVVAYNDISLKMMVVYSEKYVKNAMGFGKKYEKHFNINNFVVKTDYSGLEGGL